jgi:hypothetical protein
VPHVALPHAALTDSGVQPQTFAVPPPPHVLGAVQPPQSCDPPHVSVIVPHFPVQLQLGTHPHTPGVPPPPHVTPVPLHVPQSSVPPHASAIDPQFFPCAAHVVFVQPHTPVVPAPPHVS